MKRFVFVVLTLMIAGCAGFTRSCSSFNAETFGSDWIVVQFGYDGKPFNCWQLTNTSITNEDRSDGIYWVDSHSGHLIHISGWYNRVQVAASRFEAAARLLDVELASCVNGKYKPKEE